MDVAPNTATKYMEIVKSFFGFAVANKWILESPAKLIRGARGKAANNQKERIPFSDEEPQEMYEACEHRYGKTPIKWSREVHHRPAKNEIVNYRYVWTGEDVGDFISVSTYTGLRISDVATFHAACSNAPGAKADTGELLFYERPTGYGTFWSESQDGNISLQTVNAFRQTWSLIVPGRYTAKANGGRLDLLFYSNSDSRGEFYQSGNLGDIHQLTIATGWRSTWANIVPGNFSGSGLSDLLFYEKSTGFGEFDRSDGKGNIARMSSFTNFRTTWSIILAGNFSNGPFDDLVFYDPTNGVVEFYKVDGKGGITLLKSYSSLRTTWSIILKGKFSDSPFDDLLFYDPVNGVGEFYTVDSSQQIRLLHSYSTFRKSWPIILKGKFSNSPYDGLLFYDPTNGVGEFYSNDGKGGLALIRSHADWRKTWSIIQSL